MKEDIKKRKREESSSPENHIHHEDYIVPINETPEEFSINSKSSEQSSPGGDEEEKHYISNAENNDDMADEDYKVVDQYAEISDDEEYTEHTKEQSTYQSEDESSVSSQSISTVGGDSMFNAPVFLLIDPVKREGKLSIHFTELRPDTTLGSKQGNHFISHRLVLECCAKKMSGNKLTEIPRALDEAFKRIVPGIEYRGSDSIGYPVIPDEYPKYNKDFINIVKQTNVEGWEVALEHYKKGVRQSRTETVTKFISELLKFYNGMGDITSYVSSGNTNKSGVEVSAAIIALRGVSKVLRLPEDVSDDDKIQITQEFLGKKEQFTSGVRKLFPEIRGGVEGIRRTFGFPRDFSKTSNIENKNMLSDKFFSQLCKQCINGELIGSVIEIFLDCPPQKGIDMAFLGDLSKRCLTFAFESFNINSLDKEKIIEGFSKKAIMQKIIPSGSSYESLANSWSGLKNMILESSESKFITRG